MVSYDNLILWQASNCNFIVKFISVLWCAKETTWFVSSTDTSYFIQKYNLSDSSDENIFSYGTGCLGANGLFHFLSVQELGSINPGSPLIMIFSRVFSRHIFSGGKFAQSPYSGWEFEKLFWVPFFCERSNRVRFNSLGFMSQTIILSMAYWFLKIWSSTPLYRQKME